jgi:hypothetical protein
MPPPFNRYQVQGPGSIGSDDFNTYVQWSTNVASLRGFIGLPGMVVTILGYTTAGDGGQGDFYWNGTATATDDGTDVIVPAGVSIGAWLRLPFDVDFGLTILTPSGGDDTVAIRTASALGPIILAGGNFIISGSLVCAGFVEMVPGAVLTTVMGASVAFNGGFDAQVGQVFGVNVTVTFNSQFFSTGYPEWWGAVTDNSSFDCSPALTACTVACPVVQFQPADYWVGTTWNILTSNRNFRGVGINALGGTATTRIVTASPSIDIVQIGPTIQPSAPDFITAVTVDSLTITRTVAPNLPPSGDDPRNGVSGLKILWGYLIQANNVYINENINDFYYAGLVECYFSNIRCSRFQVASGGGSGADRYNGFFGDYTPDIGFASGNASVYFNQCFSGLSTGSPVAVENNAAFYMYGGIQDTFIDRIETTGHYNGIVGNGLNTAGGDLTINHPIIDQIQGGSGILITGVLNMTVNVNIPYVTAETGNAIEVINCTGGMTIENGQFGGDATSIGLVVNTSTGVTTLGCVFLNFSIAQQYTAATGCESTGDTISSNGAAVSAGGFVQFIGSNRNVWRSKILGYNDTAIPLGVVLSGGPSDYNEIDCSGINPTTITGGSANKLVLGGTQITSAGITSSAPSGYTHNVAAGVMN